MGAAVALLSGLVFGVGLGIAGMTDPAKILAFLDLLGHWSPALMAVMGGAIAVHAVGYRFIRNRRAAPRWGTAFHEPTATTIDARLLGGAALFGVGWGITGFCPGPGIVSLANVAKGAAAPAVFVAAMIAGMLLQRLLGRHRQ